MLDTLRFGACYLCLLLFFLIDLQIVPFFFEFDLNLQATFTLPAIYYWAIFRPRLFPAWFLFLLSLLKDLLTGLPVGLSGLMLIGVYSLASHQRNYLSGQSFMMMWIGYAVISAGLVMLLYVLLSLFKLQLLMLEPFLVEGGFMILIFPVILPVLGLLHKILPLASTQGASLK